MATIPFAKFQSTGRNVADLKKAQNIDDPFPFVSGPVPGRTYTDFSYIGYIDGLWQCPMDDLHVQSENLVAVERALYDYLVHQGCLTDD